MKLVAAVRSWSSAHRRVRGARASHSRWADRTTRRRLNGRAPEAASTPQVAGLSRRRRRARVSSGAPQERRRRKLTVGAAAGVRNPRG